MRVLEELAKYLAQQTKLAYGKQCFAYEMPDEPTECIGLIGVDTKAYGTIAQIDAVMQVAMIVVRSASNAKAAALSDVCFTALTKNAEDEDATGFIKLLNNQYAYCFLQGVPTWQKTDQQGRKYFSFTAVLTTSC